MDGKVTEGGDVVLVTWKDNSLVNVASTQVGVGDAGLAKRWSASRREYIESECPQAILEYNRHMGGIDQLDFVMSLYPLRAKTTKWPARVPSHFA